MRYGEVLIGFLPHVDVAHHYEEATSLENEVGIDIDERVVAYLCLYRPIGLNGELPEGRHIFGSIVSGEV